MMKLNEFLRLWHINLLHSKGYVVTGAKTISLKYQKEIILDFSPILKLKMNKYF